jgi:basic amino acid/polyamine antiporter, APA family
VGVGFGLAVGIGTVSGPSILRPPGQVAAQRRSIWLIVAIWVLGGVYAILGTLSVTELGTTLPREGGWFVYSREAFGNWAGFLVGCGDWTQQSTAFGYTAIVFAEFVIQLRPGLAGYLKFLAVGVVVFLTAINWIGVRSSSRTQGLTSLVKAIALTAFIAACFFAGPRAAGSSAPLPALASTGGTLLAVIIAMQSVIASYDGWYSPIYFLEENKNPVRALPRAAIGGVLTCATIYILINVALLHVLPMARLAGAQVPAADAAMTIFGATGKQIILVIAIITVLSSMNATLLCASRIAFAMGRDRLLPAGLATVNAGGTPSISLLLSAVVAIALVLTGTYLALIAVATFLFVTTYISGFCSLFKLRSRQPAMNRPFTKSGFPWTTAVALLVSVAFLIGAVVSDFKHSLFTLALIAVNYPIYRLFIKKHASQTPDLEVSPSTTSGMN